MHFLCRLITYCGTSYAGSLGKKVNVRRMSTVSASAPASLTAPKRGSKTSNDAAAAAAAATIAADFRDERVLSQSAADHEADSQYPKSLHRAAEEYLFLRVG